MSARSCGGSSRAHLATMRSIRLGIGALALLMPLALAAQAQSLKDLSGALGGATGGAGALGTLPSVDQASPSNIAGVLQYCVKNNYLGGADKAAGGSLVGKLTGSGHAAKDSGFTSGSKGLLETGGGDSFGLGGDGLQAKITDQVCDLVLKHAQSLL